MSNVFSVDKYSTLVFDCDGVVLNSNAIKTNAFYQATIGYGKAAADAMVEYHITNGGVSRYKKFAYFIEQIAPKYINNLSLSFDALLHTYSHYVRDGLLTCEVAPGLESLRKLNAKANWLIVSGGTSLNYVKFLLNVVWQIGLMEGYLVAQEQKKKYL